MKMKQLLCLLVLAVSGNALGSNGMQTGIAPTPGPAPMNMTEMATQHFAHCMDDMSMDNPAMKRMNEACKVLNSELMKQCMQCMQEAYHEGVRCGCMAAGKHMQAAMTAMTPIVNKVPMAQTPKK